MHDLQPNGTIVWQPQRTHTWLNLGQSSRLVHTRDQKIWTRNMEGFSFFGVGGNRSAQRKPTEAGMESANQIHIQTHWLASLVKGKCTSTKPTHFATGVVCHPDTEQNRPTKFPWFAGNWTGDLLHHTQELYQCATLLIIIISILMADDVQEKVGWELSKRGAKPSNCCFEKTYIQCIFIFFYCSYNLGGGTAQLQSNQTLDDGQWHKVKVEREAGDAMLIVDGFKTKGSVPGLMSSLDVDNGLYLGKYWYISYFMCQRSCQRSMAQSQSEMRSRRCHVNCR